MQDNEIVTALVALFSAFIGREHGKEPHHPVDPTQLRRPWVDCQEAAFKLVSV